MFCLCLTFVVTYRTCLDLFLNNVYIAYVLSRSLRLNYKISIIKATQTYLNLLLKAVLKKYNFKHFERQNAFQNA